MAIITIASMLASKIENENAHKYWSKVYLSIGSGTEDSQDMNHMRSILSISYSDLAPHLKLCFLYLGLYPEDSEIYKYDLIWRWFGEGFVHKQLGKSLYEVGEEYFNELMNKSLIQPAYIRKGDNKAISCRVHDMVLDLITSLSNEEHFLTTLRGEHPITTDAKIRRLSLHSSNEDDFKQLSISNLSHVRSLIFFKGFNSFPAYSSFPLLRVLNLSGCKKVDNNHCKDICLYLFLLRYLNLSRTSVTEIPREIENLQSLQVLCINGIEIEDLPSTFVRLGQILYLNVYLKTRIPDGFGSLKYLQELKGRILIGSLTNVHDLGKLTELRRLHIEFQGWETSWKEPLHRCLSNLVSLEDLTIAGCFGSLDSACGDSSPRPQQLCSIGMWNSTIHAVPNWMVSLSTLSNLTIKLDTLKERDLQILGSIPSLSRLYLGVEKPTVDRDERLLISYRFKCLSLFEYWSDTMEIEFAQGAMQNLRTLKLFIDVHKTHDHVDFGLENLSALEHAYLYLDNCPEEMHEVVEAGIRRQIHMNPNSPTLDLSM